VGRPLSGNYPEFIATTATLPKLTREQFLAHRRKVNALSGDSVLWLRIGVVRL
jgi:hypothetical protein